MKFSTWQLGIQKCLITFCILLYAVGVPILELNDTHVFNPDWTPHMRIHEVWQLLTNSMLGIACMWWLWIDKKTLRSAVVSLIVMGGFMVAFALRHFYGGSMKYLDGSEKTLFDINIGVLGFGVGMTILGLVVIKELWRTRRQKNSPSCP